MKLMYTLLALVLLAPPLYADKPGSVLFHTEHTLGSILRNQQPSDGALPYWGAVGFTYVASPEFSLLFELYHRSNADRVGGGEYNHEGLRFGFQYRFCIRNC